MSISRRAFVTDASALSLLVALLPELAAAQSVASQAAPEDTPHDSYDFWNGFFDSVNPLSHNYGQKAASRGPKDQLPIRKRRLNICTIGATQKSCAMPPILEKRNCWFTRAMWP